MTSRMVDSLLTVLRVICQDRSIQAKGKLMGTVTIVELRFLEDDVFDGELPRDDVSETEYEVTASEAARLIESNGLTFAATGNDWAADPDGSYTSNYATAERIETSAHLSGFHPRVIDAIMRKVG